MGKGIGGHTLPNRGRTDDWITPRYILKALGRFDLDPCESLKQPWPCARRGYNIRDDGLSCRWRGRVYCNPPYGDRALPFMERLASHGNGIGLLFGRTETQMFQKHIWLEADAILFLAGRLHFYLPNGQRAKGNSGGPSVLIAYGKKNIQSLRDCGLPGALVTGWRVQNLDSIMSRNAAQ